MWDNMKQWFNNRFSKPKPNYTYSVGNSGTFASTPVGIGIEGTPMSAAERRALRRQIDVNNGKVMETPATPVTTTATTGVYAPTSQTADLLATAAPATKTPFNIKDWFSKNWNKGSGIQAGNIGKMANWGAGISEGVQALGNLSDISKSNSNLDDLEGRILNAYGSNPLANDMLTSEQLSQIRNLQRGYDTESTPEFGDAISGIGNNLGSILTNTLISGAVGGIPGAVISALGGLVNSGMQGYNQAQDARASELEGLYNSLLDAESQYKSMRRPTMAGLPLQQRYIDMYQQEE